MTAKTHSDAAPTLEMVAAKAGVSRATVSRVVNGSPKVSPEITTAVREAIEALNSGRPSALEPGSRLGAAFQSLARDLAGIAKERTERQSGVLTRFVLRRA